MSARRGSNGFGRNPISYQDLDAWARLTHRSPSAFEVDLLCRLDTAFLIAIATTSEDDG